MKRFLFFLKKTWLFALFVVLETVAIRHYASSTSYSRARAVAAAERLTRGVDKRIADVNSYLGLRAENDALVAEIARLNGEIGIRDGRIEQLRERYKDSLEIEVGDTNYVFTTAAVVTNTLTRPRNFITIDKGLRDGVEPDMAVITPAGTIVGYVMEVGESISVVISLLNTEFRTSGRIKGKEYLGSVLWQGRDADYATLSEIQKYAELRVGDTVVTDYSSRFPKGVVIGTVEDWKMTDLGYFNVRVRLATHFSALGRVLLVKYFNINERLDAEEFDVE